MMSLMSLDVQKYVYAAICDPNIEGSVLVFVSSRVLAMKCSAGCSGNWPGHLHVEVEEPNFSMFNSVLWFCACLPIM